MRKSVTGWLSAAAAAADDDDDDDRICCYIYVRRLMMTLHGTAGAKSMIYHGRPPHTKSGKTSKFGIFCVTKLVRKGDWRTLKVAFICKLPAASIGKYDDQTRSCVRLSIERTCFSFWCTCNKL